MPDNNSKGYTVSQWYNHAHVVETDDEGTPIKFGAHLPNYECEQCQFATLSEDEMRAHQFRKEHNWPRPRVIKPAATGQPAQPASAPPKP